MRAIVISDTHGSIGRAVKAIDSIEHMIEAVIHLGDYSKDAELLRTRYPQLAFYSVKGNCDWSSTAPAEQIINLEGHTIFATHGHMYGVNNGIDTLAYKGLESGAELCLFGHTHIPLVAKRGKVTIMNPGSLSQPRGGSMPSYGMVIADKDGLRVTTVDCE